MNPSKCILLTATVDIKKPIQCCKTETYLFQKIIETYNRNATLASKS